MLKRQEIHETVTLKDFIAGLAEIKAPGRLLSFSEFHLFYALELMSQDTIGRSELAEQLNVGEGSTRTILSRLVAAGLVTTSKMGCVLTAEGLHVCRKFKKVFPRQTEFLWTELTPSKFNYAFLIRQSGSKVRSGMEQRDAAIVAGAMRILVVVFQGGHLRINSITDDLEETFPKVASQILRELKPREDDVIVIAGGDTALKAMHGAFSASWTLLGTEEV